MGTTPRFALPYPEPADPADVPTDMHELADRVELVIGEFAYAEITANVNVPVVAVASAVTVVSAPPATFEAQPIVIDFHASNVFAGAGAAIFIALWDGSTDLGLIGFLASA